MQALRREFRGPRRSAGVAAVEFAIAVPILIFVLLAVAELGRALIQYDTLSYSIRNSARYVSENAIVGTTGVVDVSDAVNAAKNLAVYGTQAGGVTPVLPDFKIDHVDVLNAGGGYIEVSATYPYQPLIVSALPMLPPGMSELKMRISVTMRAIS